MGECGCSGNGVFRQLPAPKKAKYVLQLQYPCSYCAAPAELAVRRYKGEMLEFAEHAKELHLHDDGQDCADAGLVILDIYEVRERVAKWLVEAKLVGDKFMADEYAEELAAECIVPLLFEQPKAGSAP